MKKTISLYQRNYDGDRLVRNEIVPGAEWVPAGEGIATRKHDGTCCMVRAGKLYKRYDAKAFTIGNNGEKQEWGRKAPPGFEPAQDPDQTTGHWPGWIPVGEGNEDVWHRDGWKNSGGNLPDGTYELCGPKLQTNPEKLDAHVLIPHGCEKLDAPRTYDELKAWLANKNIEGIVWHHPDGRMVKIKVRDFGMKRVMPNA